MVARLLQIEAKRDWFDYVKFALEIVGLVVLSVYTAYTIKMYGANEKAAAAATSAANTANDTLKTTFRPRVSVVSMQPNPNLEESRLSISLGLLNFGTIAARNIKIYRLENFGSAESISKPLLYDRGDPVGSPPAMLVPNTDDGWKVLGKKALSEEDIRALQSSNQVITFSVLIEYEGDTPGTHHTEECGLFNWPIHQAPQRLQPCPWPMQVD